MKIFTKIFWKNLWAWLCKQACRGWYGSVGWLAKNKVLLLTIGVLYVFRSAFAEWIIDIICPITSKVAGNDTSVMIIIASAIVVLYLIQYKRLLRERDLFVSRLGTLGLLFLGYWIFARTGRFEFAGIKGWPFSYVECGWILIAGIEAILLIKRLICIFIHGAQTDSYPFISDAPVLSDEMGREKYAEQLLKKIKASDKNMSSGSFAILLNEHYGVGKTSFMLQLQEKAKEFRIDVCWFKPWLYDENKTLILSFMQVINERLGEGDRPLQKLLHKYAQILASIDGYKVFSLISHDESSIESQFEEIKFKLQLKEHPIIVLIDDVDRLQSEEMLRMLQMVRNMGDFPYVYYVIAGDKVALRNRLSEAGISEPDEYLKKFFNMEICFPADDRKIEKALEEGLQAIIDRYGKKGEEVINFIHQLRYKSEIFANMRDVKRFFNLLDYTLANFQATEGNMLDEISLRDVVGVCMIQCVDSEFYQILRDHNEYVLEEIKRKFQLKKDYTSVFRDRSVKRMMNNQLLPPLKQEGQTEDNIDEEIKSNVKTLHDVKRWSKPTYAEILGEILHELFPTSEEENAKIGVRHRAEYFKYFATSYRTLDISNATIISIMNSNGTDYHRDLVEMIEEGKMDSFRLKLEWYIKDREVDRLQMLKRIMEAYELEFATNTNRSRTTRDTLFFRNYDEILRSLLYLRPNESKEAGMADWKRVSDWLISSRNYEQRITLLIYLSKRNDKLSSFIFGNKKEVVSCIEASRIQFVNKVWTKHKYDEKYYKFLPWYRDLDIDTIGDVVKIVLNMRGINEFLFHLVELKANGMRWNKSFVESVIGGYKAFSRDNMIWYNTLPAKWASEFLTFDMRNDIKDEDIEKSNFLQEAIVYWHGSLDLKDNERKVLAAINQEKEITMSRCSEMTDMTLARCGRTLMKLVELGYIKKTKKGRSLVYSVTRKGANVYRERK